MTRWDASGRARPIRAMAAGDAGLREWFRYHRRPLSVAPLSPASPIDSLTGRLKNRVVAVSEKRGRRRRRWLIALAVVAVVGVWALIVGLKTLSAYRHDKTGLAALEQVKADLSPGDLTSAQSSRLLAQAHAEFVSAQSDLSSPLFAPIQVVPVIGRQYTARPGPELGRGNGLRRRIVVHRPGARPAQSTPRRRTGSAGLPPQAQRTVTVGRAPTGRRRTPVLPRPCSAPWPPSTTSS